MTELTIELDLDEEGRTAMYEQLCDDFSEEMVEQTMEDQLIQHITQMFDNREQLKQQMQ
jgi:BioD-like phosphotransacetylase family protein